MFDMDITHIVLVVPHQPATSRLISLSKGVTHPLGIAYIAGYLKKKGFNVKILDNEVEQLDISSFKAYVSKVKPLCIGFNTLTVSIKNALSLAYAAKKISKDIKVILGGVHASALPQITLTDQSVDFVIRGEGEETAFELLNAIVNKGDFSQIKGISYKTEAGIINNPDRDLIADIDKLPFPAYELLPMNRYYSYATRRLTSRMVGTVLTGRGCPYKCTFCSHNRTIFKNVIRLRSPESVVEEMKYLISNYDVGEFILWDDCFTIDIDRAVQICRLIRNNKLNIVWACNSRVDRVSDYLYKELYLAGCRGILFGAESGSQAILDSLKKGITLSQIESSVRLSKKYHISSTCTFILGSPNETRETIKETLNFVRKIKPDFVQYCMLTPLPGSEIFDMALSKGLVDINTTDWNAYQNVLSTDLPPINMGNVSTKELVSWLKKGTREFYLNPSYILRMLRTAKSSVRIRELWRGFKAIASHQLCKIK